MPPITGRAKAAPTHTPAALSATPALPDVILETLISNGAPRDDLSLLVYLAATSRVLLQPLAVVLKDPTDTAVTILRAITSLMPPEAQLEGQYKHTTDMWWYNLPEDALLHRYLPFDIDLWSTAGTKTAVYRMVKQMIEEGQISRGNSTKGAGGKWSPRSYYHRAIVAQVGITSPQPVDPGNVLNRVLVVSVDSAVDHGGLLSSGGAPSDSRLTGPLQRYQSWLQTEAPYTVLVPFTQQLARLIDPAVRRHRTITDALVLLTQTATVMHKAMRKRSADGALVATLDDYELARRLLLPVVSSALEPVCREDEIVEQVRAALPQFRFTTNDVIRAMGWEPAVAPMRASRLLRDLVQQGVLVLVRKGWGRTASIFQWASANIEKGLPLLPTVADLQKHRG